MEQTTFLSLMYAGGAVMWPLFGLLALAVVVIVERVITFALVSGKRAVLDRTKAERLLSLLDLITMISPVLGFLGTVTGMINAFKAVSNAATVQLQVVASGLYEALYTTAFGLIIAVITTLASHLLGLWLDSLCDEDPKK
ncbi:MAG: MotA/TolQ/ExbB proton channel family protein [Sphaerochaeta sp.]|jgi:biopolymer transport protein ExbB/TolQ|nr:MotA/TolQ/ExbB proton channel family protein [Sphaerochaeta sp.]MCH3919077.1 MotA/TolQ/ExbB proton channel family protein [Sphaerochaeta sp.]MCI2075826.1 MotA/TolQ/ExbB proton channel family protein [Sphaerochaeta sp.]